MFGSKFHIETIVEKRFEMAYFLPTRGERTVNMIMCIETCFKWNGLIPFEIHFSRIYSVRFTRSSIV